MHRIMGLLAAGMIVAATPARGDDLCGGLQTALSAIPQNFAQFKGSAILDPDGNVPDANYPAYQATFTLAGADSCLLVNGQPDDPTGATWAYQCRFPTTSTVKNPYEPEHGDDASLSHIDANDALLTASVRQCIGPAAKLTLNEPESGVFGIDAPGADLLITVSADDVDNMGGRLAGGSGPPQFHLQLWIRAPLN